MARTALMYMSYDLSHYLEGDISQSTSFTVSDDDAINCAHMLAAGFNTISRKMMGDFVLAVVDTKAGTVQYDGKIEKIDRPEPESKAADEWPMNNYFTKTFNFEGSPNGESLITFFGENDATTYTLRGDVKVADDHEAVAKRLHRGVLESAYAELQAVKEVLADAGVETIPADRGATDLRAVLRARDAEIAELVQERANANAAARTELIEHVKRAYAKWGQLDPGRQRAELKSHLRGMIEVLSKFLVAIGEAEVDERHAVAKRLCGIPEGSYLYDDA